MKGAKKNTSNLKFRIHLIKSLEILQAQNLESTTGVFFCPQALRVNRQVKFFFKF